MISELHHNKKLSGHTCPVCGYDNLDQPPYSRPDNTGSPSFEICSSCGYQYGYTDDAINIPHVQWRQQWIANGMIWDKGQSTPPDGWNPREQLLNIGIKI